MQYIETTSSPQDIEQLLVSKKWLNDSESILSIEKPGEGNMNVVLRVKTNQRSLILKQSRPYVQKYQQIDAPLDRIFVEQQFYQLVNNDGYFPNIHAVDTNDHLMLMQDLGHCEDMSFIYSQKEIKETDLNRLVQIIGNIHQSQVTNDFPKNIELRKLNHQHIFVLPFLEENGFQLDDVQTGLQDLSLTYKKDNQLKAIITKLGDKYLDSGNVLLHGDYYPGSWMATQEKLFVIDPEFSFVGFAEFDLGVMAAHIIMATGNWEYLQSIPQQYQGAKIEINLVKKMAGIEIMRRLIGLAQLPLERTISEKKSLLDQARILICS